MENTDKPEIDFTWYPEIGFVYTHYKGGKYEVLMLAKHSETNEELVIYKSVQFGNIYARPLSMFFEIVTNHEGFKVMRFREFNYIKK